MKTMKKVYTMMLNVIVIVGLLSLIYMVLVFISLAGMLDGGGTGEILESCKSPILYIGMPISIIFLAFLKKTRKRLIGLD